MHHASMHHAHGSQGQISHCTPHARYISLQIFAPSPPTAAGKQSAQESNLPLAYSLRDSSGFHCTLVRRHLCKKKLNMSVPFVSHVHAAPSTWVLHGSCIVDYVRPCPQLRHKPTDCWIDSAVRGMTYRPWPILPRPSLRPMA